MPENASAEAAAADVCGGGTDPAPFSPAGAVAADCGAVVPVGSAPPSRRRVQSVAAASAVVPEEVDAPVEVAPTCPAPSAWTAATSAAAARPTTARREYERRRRVRVMRKT